MKDQAIYNTHPNVVEIINGTECFDTNGNLVVIDDAKVSTELNKLQAKYDAQKKIDELERQVTQRRMRDAIAGTDGGWLANIEAQIAEERSKL